MAGARLSLGARDAVASHYSAARIYGWTFLHEPGAGVTLSRPDGRERRSPGLDVHVVTLPGRHRRIWLGVPVTSPARTVVDLARLLPFRDAVVIADSAFRSTPMDACHMWEVLATCSGWPGAACARDVVRVADHRAESALESVGRVFFAEPGCQVVRFMWHQVFTIPEQTAARFRAAFARGSA